LDLSDVLQALIAAVIQIILQFGVARYASVPLLKRGDLLGAVDFISYELHIFQADEVQLKIRAVIDRAYRSIGH
jgi:GAF domain-containing protein